jgi:hypothetical protein
MKVRQINPISLKDQPTKELFNLHFRIHQLFANRENLKNISKEDLVNAYIFIVKELRHRRYDIKFVGGLGREATRLLAKTMEEKNLSLDVVQKVCKDIFNGQVPDNIVLDYLKLKPFVLIDSFVSVTGSEAYGLKDQPQDRDMVVRLPYKDPKLEGKIDRYFTNTQNHYVYDPSGPCWHNIPIADLVVVPRQGIEYNMISEGIEHYLPENKPEWLNKATSIQPGKPYTPMKSVGGYREGEFFDRNELWSQWVKPYLTGDKITPVDVEVKYDGIRLEIHKKGNQVWIYTEDVKSNRASFLPEVVAEVKTIPGDFIIDTEAVKWENNNPLPRQVMVGIVNGKEPITNQDWRFNVHDILYLNGKDLTSLPWIERYKIRQAFLTKDLKFLKTVKSTIASNETEFNKALDYAESYPGSEGAMIKLVNSTYDISGKRTNQWVKYKLAKELRVMVIGRRKSPMPVQGSQNKTAAEMLRLLSQLIKDSDTWTYRVAFKDGDKLIPIDSDKTLTEGDLKIKWNDTLKEHSWAGLDDPMLWEMGKGFIDRKAGEYAYGNTFNYKPEEGSQVKVGDLITVRPIGVRDFTGTDGKIHYAWMFPIVSEQDPEYKDPDTLETVRHIISESKLKPVAIQKAPGEPLTNEKRPSREKQRAEAEKKYGDWYMVSQPVGVTYPFVFMHHLRGIWTKIELDNINQVIDKLQNQDALNKLWRTYKLAVLKTDLNKIKTEAQKVSDINGDVSKEINKYLDFNVIKLNELSKLKSKIVNVGNVHGDLRFGTNTKLAMKFFLSGICSIIGFKVSDNPIIDLLKLVKFQKESELNGNFLKANIIKRALLSSDITHLFGWTLNTPSALFQYLNGDIEYILRDKFLDYKEGDNIESEKKAAQPTAWLTIVSEKKPLYESQPGMVGATEETGGEFIWRDGGEYVAGIQKSDYHEYFLFFNKHKALSGRWGWQLIGGNKNYKNPKDFWLANRPINQTPYVEQKTDQVINDKAKQEKIDVVINREGTIDTLKEMGLKI